MLAGLGDYGSGSESEGESSSPVKATPSQQHKRKKIAFGLPALSNPAKDDLDDDKPPPKKSRMESGAGLSSLLSMLPAPTQKQPVRAAPERVLGGGKGPGLVFKTIPAVSIASNGDADQDEAELENTPGPSTAVAPAPPTSFSLMPTSVAKRRPNISVEEDIRQPVATKVSSAPAVDFFGLGSSTSASSQILSTKASLTPPSIPKPALSSAPEVVEFKPPTPTPQDPYPGYYILPSGGWAAYDPEYYNPFLKKWQRDYDAQVRALEKGTAKGFEGSEDSEEVNAMKEMEKARKEIQERESRKAVTKDATGEPAKPRMNIDPAKLSGRAKSRHQLSSLLTDAYQNRETLEEKIAEGRRNRKEAGNKYGF